MDISKEEAKIVTIALRLSLQKLWNDSSEAKHDENVRHTVIVADLIDKFEAVN